MTMGLDRGIGRRLSIRVASGPAFQALLSLALAGGEIPASRYANGGALLERYGRLPERLRGLISTVDSGFGLNWSDLVGSLCAPEPVSTLTQALARLSSMPPLDLKLAMLGYHVVAFRELIGEDLFREAALGAPAPARRFKLRAGRSGRGWGPLVSLPPKLVADRTLEILAGLPTGFYLPDDGGDDLLAQAAEAARALTAAMEPEAVIDRLTRGVIVADEPGVNELIVIPNLVSRPWTLLLEHEAIRIVSYPTRQPVDPGRPQPEMVDVYRALADETRLRLLKRLKQGPASFGQLREELGLARSTLHHHVVILRTAGLVRVRLGATSRPELNADLPSLDRLLADYLDS